MGDAGKVPGGCLWKVPKRFVVGAGRVRGRCVEGKLAQLGCLEGANGKVSEGDQTGDSRRCRG